MSALGRYVLVEPTRRRWRMRTGDAGVCTPRSRSVLAPIWSVIPERHADLVGTSRGSDHAGTGRRHQAVRDDPRSGNPQLRASHRLPLHRFGDLQVGRPQDRSKRSSTGTRKSEVQVVLDAYQGPRVPLRHRAGLTIGLEDVKTPANKARSVGAFEERADKVRGPIKRVSSPTTNAVRNSSRSGPRQPTR